MGDVAGTLNLVLATSGRDSVKVERKRPHLSYNGPCYTANDLSEAKSAKYGASATEH
jgi:hypothetical protein